jgi:hypothetical protein
MFEGYGQSIINENANNRVKDAMRDSKGLIISRDKRLYILAAKKQILAFTKGMRSHCRMQQLVLLVQMIG